MPDNNVTNLDDLEQYGVWVKVGPTDMDDGDEQFAMSDIEPMQGADSDESDAGTDEDLTPEEEALLDPLEEALDSDDSSSDETESPETESIDDFDADIDDLSLDELTDEDDFSFDEDFTEETRAEEPELMEDVMEEDSSSAAGPSLDDADDLEESFAVGSDDIGDLDLDLEDDGLGGFDDEGKAEEASAEDESDNAEDLPSGEDFGDFDDVEELDLDIDDFDESEVPELEPTETDTHSKPAAQAKSDGAEADKQQTPDEDDLDLEIASQEDPRDVPSLDLDSVTEEEINAALQVEEEAGEEEELSLADDELDSIDLEDLDSDEGDEDLPELELESIDEDDTDDEAPAIEEPTEAATVPEESDDQAWDEPDFGDEELPVFDVDEDTDDKLDELGEIEENPLQETRHGEAPPTHGFTLEEEDENEDHAVDDLLVEEPTEPSQSDTSESVRLLQTIESDLSQIKQELFDLKQELSGIREGRHQSHGEPPETVPATGSVENALGLEGFNFESGDEADSDEAGAGTGFFEDDEDETIALTGDELDNILNTAEFTEEVGEPTRVDDSDLVDTGATAEPEEPVTKEAPVLEEAQDTDEEPPIEEITFDQLNSEQADSNGFDLPADEPEDELSALADLDVDSELADIDELKDQAKEEEESEEESLEEQEDFDIAEVEDTPPEDDEIVLYPEGDLKEPIADEPPESPPPLEPQSPETTGVEEEPLSGTLRSEIRSVLAYMDQLLEALPEDKIEEFAKSEHFEVYKRLFEELGLE